METVTIKEWAVLALLAAVVGLFFLADYLDWLEDQRRKAGIWRWLRQARVVNGVLTHEKRKT